MIFLYIINYFLLLIISSAAQQSLLETNLRFIHPKPQQVYFGDYSLSTYIKDV